MALLAQSAARNRVFSFAGVSITVLTVTISKDGGAFAAAAGALSNITGVYYKLALASGDTDTLGDLAYKFSDSVLGVIAPDGGDVDQVLAYLPGDPATPVTLADAVAHGGTLGSSTATLALDRLSVVTSSVSDNAVNVAHNGGHSALSLYSANGQASLYVQADNGNGVLVLSTDGDAVSLSPFAMNSPGVNGLTLIGSGTGAALALTGGVSPGVPLDLTQAVPNSNTDETVGDCLNAARAQGFGKWVLDPVGLTLKLYAADGTTVVHTFTIDSSTAPTRRS